MVEFMTTEHRLPDAEAEPRGIVRHVTTHPKTWLAYDVIVDDLNAWANSGDELGLTRRQRRRLRRAARDIERTAPTE